MCHTAQGTAEGIVEASITKNDGISLLIISEKLQLLWGRY